MKLYQIIAGGCKIFATTETLETQLDQLLPLYGKIEIKYHDRAGGELDENDPGFIPVRELKTPGKRGRGKKEYYGFGEWHTIQEWGQRLGLSYSTVKSYLSTMCNIESIVKIRGIDYPKN